MVNRPAWLEAAETSAQGATAPGQPQPEWHDKILDNLIFISGLHPPMAVWPQQVQAARKRSGTETRQQSSLTLKDKGKRNTFAAFLLKFAYIT